MSLDSLERKLNSVSEESDEELDDDASYARFKKIIYGLISFFGFIILVAGIVLYFVLFNGGSHGIDLAIVVPDDITSGVPFDIVATISNKQDIAVGDAKMRLDLPPDLLYLGVATSDGGSATTDSVGDVAAGSFTKHTFKVLPTGKLGSSEKISIGVSYASGSNSRFELKGTKEIVINNSPVTLEIKMPGAVIRGSLFEFDINYKNVTQFDFPDVALEINYPDTFRYDSASIPPEAANNYWRLGRLSRGTTGNIKVKGVYTGPDEVALEIPITFYAQFSGKDYEIAESKTTATPSPSPVRLSILINNQEKYVARLGDKLTFAIHYENRSGVALSDVVLKANINGEMLDMDTLTTNARVNSATSWLTWDAANVPQFKLLDAGAVGDMTASVRIKNLYPIQNSSDKNFVVRVSANLESPTVPPYMSATKTTSAISGEIKMGGLIALTSQLFFRDANIDSVNAGEFPPRVGKPTEYTAHWVVRNFATDARDVTIRAKLRSGVAFVESVQSSASGAPSYDASTGEVVLHIDRIPATKGAIGNPLEATFRVRATPSASDMGQFMQILGESILQATDDFTGLELDARGVGLSTALTDDKTVGAEGGKVVQ